MRRVGGETEVGEVLGYLGANGILYCSAGCASEASQPWAVALDLDEYDALASHGYVTVDALCPVCGQDYAIWGEEEPAG
jgi:hypothetical protein